MPARPKKYRDCWIVCGTCHLPWKEPGTLERITSLRGFPASTPVCQRGRRGRDQVKEPGQFFPISLTPDRRSRAHPLTSAPMAAVRQIFSPSLVSPTVRSSRTAATAYAAPARCRCSLLLMRTNTSWRFGTVESFPKILAEFQTGQKRCDLSFNHRCTRAGAIQPRRRRDMGTFPCWRDRSGRTTHHDTCRANKGSLRGSNLPFALYTVTSSTTAISAIPAIRP